MGGPVVGRGGVVGHAAREVRGEAVRRALVLEARPDVQHLEPQPCGDLGRVACGERGNPHFAAISESPRFVGRAVAALAADPDVARRNGGSFSSGQLAREYGFTDIDGSQPDCWRYIVEVQDAGLPPDPTGYR